MGRVYMAEKSRKSISGKGNSKCKDKAGNSFHDSGQTEAFIQCG